MKTIAEFARAKRAGKPIVILAAYDALMARLLAAADVDAILVGDSAAMVAHGFPSTVHATVEMMATHVAAVHKAAPETLVVADLPFLSVRCGRDAGVAAAGALIQAGATAVKIEGVTGHEEVIEHLVGSGIPVIGHLGVTPQAVHQQGYRVQGRTRSEANRLKTEARLLQRLGAFALVLECVFSSLAGAITRQLDIPTIGIGAGPNTSGQVLVLADILGLDPTFRPRFARRYLDGAGIVTQAINAFARDVRLANFPAGEEFFANPGGPSTRAVAGSQSGPGIRGPHPGIRAHDGQGAHRVRR